MENIAVALEQDPGNSENGCIMEIGGPIGQFGATLEKTPPPFAHLACQRSHHTIKTHLKNIDKNKKYHSLHWCCPNSSSEAFLSKGRFFVDFLMRSHKFAYVSCQKKEKHSKKKHKPKKLFNKFPPSALIFFPTELRKPFPLNWRFLFTSVWPHQRKEAQESHQHIKTDFFWESQQWHRFVHLATKTTLPVVFFIAKWANSFGVDLRKSHEGNRSSKEKLPKYRSGKN